MSSTARKRASVRAPVHDAATAATRRSGASTPKPHNAAQQQQQQRHKDQLASSLRATQLLQTSSKAALPAELLEVILDYLPVADLMRCARASRRMQEMVYDDSRWVKKLRAMGCWDEGQARRRAEEGMVKRRTTGAAGGSVSSPVDGRAANMNGSNVRRAAPALEITTTLFDAGFEEQKAQQRASVEKERQNQRLSNGFEALNLGGTNAPAAQPKDALQAPHKDLQYVLTALSRVRSIRGGARQEYGKVYGALAPYYFDIATSSSHANIALFITFKEPEQQAQVLTQLRRFSKSDAADGWPVRVEQLESMIGIFENAVLREFEQGHEAKDYDGRTRRYAHVLYALNGGAAGVDIFIQNQPLMREKNRLGNPLDCIRDVPIGGISPGPSYDFFRELSAQLNEQGEIIDKVFPSSVDVLMPFIERVTEDVILEYITTALDDAHDRNIESYLKLMAALFEQSLQFANNVQPTKASKPDLKEKVKEVILHCFDSHIDLYLNEELAFFTKKSDAEVTVWEKRLQDEAASTESFYMSNVQRQAAKNDFLSSFKKVVMMPVTVLPTIANPFPFAATSKTPSSGNTTTTALANSDTLEATPSRSTTPVPGVGRTSPRPGSVAPTTELAAKAAIMSSRLAGISGLFSIEVALTLTHAAKASLDRTALLVQMGGQTGEEAREQCESIFVALLQILGTRHVKTGFDKAVIHLSEYDPRAVAEHNAEDGSIKGVEPLVTFLELVNVGDLIMQMVDVFFLQELSNHKLVDRDDFLSPAVKEKKRFEQTLDERVAAGLSKGIDVLIDEVDFICSTTQPPGASTFNPAAAAAKGEAINFDIGPTDTAKKIVDMVGSHTSMLVGSTDKNVLDVFNQEVGVRLFTALCKHLKRQRVSMDGAMKLISDTNHYYAYVVTLKNKALNPYFAALRELAQIYLVDAKHYPKELASIIADGDKYYGIFRAEEVLEFAERRADWFEVRYAVERAMFGLGCTVM